MTFKLLGRNEKCVDQIFRLGYLGFFKGLYWELSCLISTHFQRTLKTFSMGQFEKSEAPEKTNKQKK